MSKGSVLLVEDSKDVRQVIGEIISLLGYEVTLVVDGVEAWEKIRENRYDLVITDMGLPNMNGEELTRKMRLEKIEIPVILIGGVAGKRKDFKSTRMPNCDFIQKPFKIEELKSKIAESLNPSGKKPRIPKDTK